MTMNLKTIQGRHIRLIGWQWTRNAVRGGGGLIYLLAALFFGLMVAHLLITPIEGVIAQQEKKGLTVNRQDTIGQIVDMARPVIEWAILGTKTKDEILETGTQPQPPYNQKIEPEDPWSKFLLEDRPAILSVVFLILIFGMPFLISLLAFNQFSGDVQSRGLRYLLIRTERSNIYVGRFLGTALFSTIVIAAIVAPITFYVGVKLKIYSAGALSLWGLQGFLALSVQMLPYIALCTLVSAVIDSPFLSLIVDKLIIGGVLLFAFLGGLAWKPAQYLIYALPWGLQNHLLHPDASHWLVAGLECLGYTAVFFLLGYIRFQRRDL
jgi:ABC-type transport system involved in multi-copper enzyme maturation permease subunit